MNQSNQTTRSANFSWYASFASLGLLILGPVINKLGVASVFVGMSMLMIAVLLSIIVVIMGALSLRKSANPANHSRLRIASLLALPALLALAVMMSGGRGPVMMHDISTDTTNPPVFTAGVTERGAKSNSLEYNTEKSALQAKGYPDIKSINSTLDSAAAFARATETAEKMGWEIYRSDAANGMIEGVATTKWFSFKDDIAIRITANGTGSIIDVRSISRVGKGDTGTNAKRVREFIQLFTAS